MNNREKTLARILELQNETKRIKAEMDNLWEKLEISGPQDPEVYSDFVLKVTERSTFNAGTAKRNLSPEQLAQISTLQPDHRLAKVHLDEDSYKILCCNQSITRKIDPVEDDK